MFQYYSVAFKAAPLASSQFLATPAKFDLFKRQNLNSTANLMTTTTTTAAITTPSTHLIPTTTTTTTSTSATPTTTTKAAATTSTTTTAATTTTTATGTTTTSASNPPVIIPISISTTNAAGKPTQTTISVVAPEASTSLLTTLTTTVFNTVENSASAMGTAIVVTTSLPAEIITDTAGQTTIVAAPTFVANSAGPMLLSTSTNAQGSTYVTTITPESGGVVSSILLLTTTLPDGAKSTMTSFTRVPTAQATQSAKPELQGGVAGRPKRFGLAGLMLASLLFSAILQ